VVQISGGRTGTGDETQLPCHSPSRFKVAGDAPPVGWFNLIHSTSWRSRYPSPRWARLPPAAHVSTAAELVIAK